MDHDKHHEKTVAWLQDRKNAIDYLKDAFSFFDEDGDDLYLAVACEMVADALREKRRPTTERVQQRAMREILTQAREALKASLVYLQRHKDVNIIKCRWVYSDDESKIAQDEALVKKILDRITTILGSDQQTNETT